MTRLTRCLSTDLGKDQHAPILKSEFVSWTCQALFEIADVKLDTIYESLFLAARSSVFKSNGIGENDTLGGESSQTFDDTTTYT